MPPAFSDLFAPNLRNWSSILGTNPPNPQCLWPIFFDQEKPFDVAPNFCPTWIPNLCPGIHSGLLLTNPGRWIFLFHPFFSSLVWRFVFSFFSFRLICFSKQLSNSPSFSSFIRMSCFKVVHRHLSSIFSRGLGDKCTPGASAKSQKRGDVGEVVLQKEVGDPPLSSKKIHPRMINIAPEKWWLEDYFPIGKVTFQGLW